MSSSMVKHFDLPTVLFEPETIEAALAHTNYAEEIDGVARVYIYNGHWKIVEYIDYKFHVEALENDGIFDNLFEAETFLFEEAVSELIDMSKIK